MSNADLSECYWLETHYPVDLIYDGHTPERFTGQGRRREDLSAFERAIRALRRKAKRVAQ
jgi:hypothetical protein